MTNKILLSELQSKRNYIAGKMEYIRQCIRAGIGSIELTVKDPENRESFYFTKHDLPFNLELEASILFWDALDTYQDQIAEIDCKIEDLLYGWIDEI